MTRNVLIAITLAGLSACSSVPDTKIKSPLSVRPEPPAVVADNQGAIFQAGASRPRVALGLFEDRRARQVGDTLTVNLVENSSVKRTSSTTDERKISGTINVPSPTVLGRTSTTLGATSWTPSSDNKLENTDNRNNTNTIAGSISVTVIEVLPNGNLRVAGEKQLSINNETEYIRLAGVVNPQLLTSANTINSNQVADVQFESKSTQGIEVAQLASMLARFFLTVIPF